jgi:hypothetical protein
LFVILPFLMLLCCYTVVELWSHCRYTVVTRNLRCCYRVLILLLHYCYMDVTLFHNFPASKRSLSRLVSCCVLHVRLNFGRVKTISMCAA